MYEAEFELEQILRSVDRRVDREMEAEGELYDVGGFLDQATEWVRRLRSTPTPELNRDAAVRWIQATARDVQSHVEEVPRPILYQLLTRLNHVNRETGRRQPGTPVEEPPELRDLRNAAWQQGGAGRLARQAPPPPRRSSPPPSRGPTGTQRIPGVPPPPPRVPEQSPSTLRTGLRLGQREAEAELSRILRQVDRVAAEAEFEARLRF